MRITGGTARGQQLKVPRGGLTRPTTDRTREAIFSILASLNDNRYSRCLDLYAGTGALGIEALSRNAEWADFVDQNPRNCAIIKANLKQAGFIDKSRVYCLNVAKAFTILEDEYDVIFMDPPYTDRTIPDQIMLLTKSPIAAEKSLLVVSHTNRTPLNKHYDGMRLIKEKRHGDTCISIFYKEVDL